MKVEELKKAIGSFEKLYRIMSAQYRVYMSLGEIIETSIRSGTGEEVDSFVNAYELRVDYVPDKISITPLSVPSLIELESMLTDEQIVLFEAFRKVYEEIKPLANEIYKYKNFQATVYPESHVISLDYGTTEIVYHIRKTIRITCPPGITCTFYAKANGKTYRLSYLKDLEIIIPTNKATIHKKTFDVSKVEIVDEKTIHNINKILEYAEKITPLLKKYYDKVNPYIALIGVFP